MVYFKLRASGTTVIGGRSQADIITPNVWAGVFWLHLFVPLLPSMGDCLAHNVSPLRKISPLHIEIRMDFPYHASKTTYATISLDKTDLEQALALNTAGPFRSFHQIISTKIKGKVSVFLWWQELGNVKLENCCTYLR